jgi:hypothetical protein
MPRPLRFGPPFEIRLRLEDVAAFDAMPGTDSEKARELIHKALTAAWTCPGEDAGVRDSRRTLG